MGNVTRRGLASACPQIAAAQVPGSANADLAHVSFANGNLANFGVANTRLADAGLELKANPASACNGQCEPGVVIRA